MWAKAFKAGTVFFDTTIKQFKVKGVSHETQKMQAGIPSVHGFNYLVEAFLECLLAKHNKIKEEPSKEQEAKKAEEMHQLVKESVSKWPNWQHIHKFIPHARLHNMYHPNERRLEISCPSELQVEELGASEMLAHDHGRPAAAAATPADDAFVRGLQSHPASEGLGARINIL